jgi:hypothetical protein
MADDNKNDRDSKQKTDRKSEEGPAPRGGEGPDRPTHW